MFVFWYVATQQNAATMAPQRPTQHYIIKTKNENRSEDYYLHSFRINKISDLLQIFHDFRYTNYL